MLLTVSDLNKSFGERVLFDRLSFSLDENEKLGVIGQNGCGKSTLLKIITGEMPSSGGSVTIREDVTVGYLAQYQKNDLDGNIFDVVLSSRQDLINREKELISMENEMKSLSGPDLENLIEKYHALNEKFIDQGGNVFRSLAVGILKGLGFSEDDFSLQYRNLSGGQKTRVSLGRLLLSNPKLLILDEPTNHLDISSVEWLENFLYSYKGSCILVSHDRYFLDHIIDHCLDISGPMTRMYTGNYTEFLQKKKGLRDSMIKAYEKQQAKIEHEEKVIDTLRRFNREKSIKRADSRQKMLDKIDILDKPEEEQDKMRLHFNVDKRSGDDVLNVSSLSKAFGDNVLFTDLSFLLKRGDHLAILGDNGTGKTTLLKIINGLIPFDEGTIKLGSNVSIGYYDQAQQNLDDDATLFQELRNTYPTLNDTVIRNTLAAFGFRNDDVFRLVGKLSGGERARLALSKLSLQGSNFLILDEPTNHLDIRAKEILEDALLQYEGTILFVSHDRYFVNRIANRIIFIDKDGTKSYLGNYDDYLREKKKEEDKIVTEKAVNDNRKSYEEQKKEKAKQQKLEREIKTVEDRISLLESRSQAIEEEMAIPENAVNLSKLNELGKEKNIVDTELESLYEKWEKLQEDQG